MYFRLRLLYSGAKWSLLDRRLLGSRLGLNQRVLLNIKHASPTIAENSVRLSFFHRVHDRLERLLVAP